MSRVVKRAIYKYKLVVSGIQMPEGAKILALQLQDNEPHLWCEVNPNEKKMVTRHFIIYGTGNEVYGNAEYVGTYQKVPFVWHVYEEKR